MKSKIGKRLLTFVLSAAMALTCVPTTALAAEPSDSYGMQTGKSYVVPIQSWGGSSDDYGLSNINTITDLFFISHDAIVTPEESGKYKVTIQVENYERMVTYQIFKQGSFPKKTNKSDVKCGSVGLDGYKYKGKMQELGLMDESNNDKLYQSNEIEITPIDGTTNKYLTFEVDNLEEHLYTYWVKSADYGRCPSADRQDILWKSDLGFDTANITSLPASLSDYKNGGAFFDIVSDKNRYPYNQGKDGQVLNNLVNVTVTVDSNSASAKLQSDQIKELYSCGTPETVTPGRSPERYIDDYTWNEVALTDGVAEITYNNVKEALFGKKLQFVMKDGSKYYATLKLKTTAKEAVSFYSNGITLTSDNYNLKENTVFEATPVTKGTDYDNAMSTVGGVSTSAKLFSLSFKANDTAYTPDNRVTLSFDIPEGWDADKTQLYVFFADEKSSMNINSAYGEVSVADGKLNYKTTKLDGYQYILFQKSDVTDVTTLSDGVYSVGVNIWNYEQPESPSMANNAVKGGKAALHIYNNGANKDLYFDMQGITIPLAGKDYFGYMYRMFYYPKKDSKEADLQEVNYTKYMVNENNSPDIDEYHLNYPGSIAIPIPETYDFTRNKTTLKNVFKINVIVPIMDGLAGGEPGDGASARDALVQIFDAEKIDGEETHTLTPSLKDVDKTELKKYIDQSEKYNSADYEKDTFAAFTTVLEESKTVYDDINATQVIVDAQVDKLISAIEKLTGGAIKTYDEGVYTADSRIVETDGTLGYHQGLAGETRIAVDKDGNATVYMTLEKAKTVFDGQELASYYVDGFLYKDGDTYKTATVLETVEEDGTTYPVKVSFPVSKLKKNIAVGFYADGDTDWVNEISLELTNIKAQKADKTELNALVKELSALKNEDGAYTSESFEAVTAALKTAKTVNDNPVAIQSEIDEQVTACKAAKEGLKEVNPSLNLEEGVYTVDSRVVETDGTLGYHQGLAGETRLVVDKDGNATVYMNLEKSKTVFDGQEMGSYYIDGFLYKDGTEFKSATVLATIEEDGTTYPAKVAFPIGKVKQLVQVGFYSDGDTSWVNEIGLELTNPQKQNADKTELDALVKELSALKNDDGAYTADSFAAVAEALKNAKAVNDDPAAIQSEIEEQVTACKAAKEGLEETNPSLNLEEGLYTADSRIVETDGTLGYHQGLAGETRLVVDKDGNATVYMSLEKSKTVFDGQELASYYVDGFLYKDGKEFKAATVLATIEEDGTVYPTRVAFPIGKAKQLVQVGFYSDGDTSWVNEIGLELSNVQKTEVTKANLEETLAKAEDALSGSYTTESLAKLHEAIASASEVLNDPAAIQSEVDAQVTALENAINALERKIDFAKLKEAIQNAEEKKEDDYTPNSYQALKTTLDAAKALAEDEAATQEQIDQVVLELTSKMEGLIARADTTELQALYEEACKMEDAGYLNWETFVTARDKAKEALEDANISQAEVNARAAALQLAMESLSTNVDKSALQDLVNRAEAIDTENYLPKGADAFKKAIESAKAVLKKANATQQEVDKQIQLIEKTSAMLIQKPDDNVVFNGTYTINGIMKMASSDRDSMGNPAVVKPMTVVVDGDNVTLKMEFVPLTAKLGSDDLTGYLARLNYFPGWTGGESGIDAPTGMEAVGANVDEYYDGVYDAYNDPDNGLDANVKGQLYPHYMSMPISLGQETIWVQVYVPVMESIQQGNGLQYARLNLDWSTREQITGVDTDKTNLSASIEAAKALLAELKEGDYGYSSENMEMLTAAIEADQEIFDNLNVDQIAVDAATESLIAAMNVFNKDAVTVDKSELKKAIEAADSYLNNSDVTYTQTTREALENARDNAKAVYEAEDVTQTQVNNAVDVINKAISALQIEGADKSELKKALTLTGEYLADTENYTAASLETLKSLYDTANGVYADENATQEEVDAQVRILNYAVQNLKKVNEPEETVVDKSGLHAMLVTASNMAGREALYTAASIENLKTAIKAAEALYADENSTQEAVNEQASKLSMAILNLEAKPAGSNNGGNNNNNNGNNNNGNDNNGGLDIKNLADGVYSITGNMVKIDKTTTSMSDAAINHTIKLTVKNGKYTITLNFNGLTISQKLGYLSTLKYFTTGYTLDKYGNPQGKLADVTVDSYQKNADGTLVSDTYGTNYPDEVTFELIPEALNDGYAPLQVFVPIMEAISKGTGTQPVFLKLDWSTIKSTTANDPNFSKNDNTNNNTNTNGNLTNGSSLGKNTLGSGTLKSSSLKSGTSSLGSSSSLKSGTSSLSSSALKSGSSSLESGSGSSLQNASSVKTDDEIQNNTVWAALLLLGGVALLAGIMGYGRKRRAGRK